MMVSRGSWLRSAIAVLLCLAIGQSLFALAFESDGLRGSSKSPVGTMAGPVKPAGQFIERHDLSIESAKTRSAASALSEPAGARHCGPHFHSASLDSADQPRQPLSALLRVRRGRAPPALL